MTTETVLSVIASPATTTQLLISVSSVTTTVTTTSTVTQTAPTQTAPIYPNIKLGCALAHYTTLIYQVSMIGLLKDIDRPQDGTPPNIEGLVYQDITETQCPQILPGSHLITLFNGTIGTTGTSIRLQPVDPNGNFWPTDNCVNFNTPKAPTSPLGFDLFVDGVEIALRFRTYAAGEYFSDDYGRYNFTASLVDCF